MAELIVTTFLSLDGVYQGPGGVEEDPSDGFDLGGWVTPFYEDDMAAYAMEWLAQAGALLLGRRTYDIFVQHWPKATDPMATLLNGLPKYVASRTVSESDWSGVSFVEDVVDFVRELKSRPGGELQVHGSGDLLQTLIAHDLVDEYRLWLYPVVLGKGRKLFPAGVARRRSSTWRRAGRRRACTCWCCDRRGSRSTTRSSWSRSDAGWAPVLPAHTYPQPARRLPRTNSAVFRTPPQRSPSQYVDRPCP